MAAAPPTAVVVANTSDDEMIMPPAANAAPAQGGKAKPPAKGGKAKPPAKVAFKAAAASKAAGSQPPPPKDAPPTAAAAAGGAETTTELQSPMPKLADEGDDAETEHNIEDHCRSSVQCLYCGSFCELHHVRVKSKGRGTFKCLHCVSVNTKLYRMGPFPKVEGMPDEDRHAFYKRAKEAHSTQDLQDALRELIHEKIHEKTKSYVNAGEFHPLKYWKKRGYNAKRIKTMAKADDKRTDPVLGKVYRVVIMKTSDGGSSATRTTDVTRASHGQKREREEETDEVKVKRLELELSKTKKQKHASETAARLAKKHKAQASELVTKCRLALAENRDKFSPAIVAGCDTLFTKFGDLKGAAAKDTISHVKLMESAPLPTPQKQVVWLVRRLARMRQARMFAGRALVAVSWASLPTVRFIATSDARAPAPVLVRGLPSWATLVYSKCI
jgi:hypothetical protein